MLVDGEYPIQEVAATLGVHRTTIWRWFQHKEMQRYYGRYYDKKINAEMREIRREVERVWEKRREKISEMLNSDNPAEVYATAIRVIDVWTTGVWK